MGAIQNADIGEDGRQTAAVLLRRLLSAEFFEFFPKLPFEQQTMLREQLLLTLQMDVSQQLRRKVCIYYKLKTVIIKIIISSNFLVMLK